MMGSHRRGRPPDGDQRAAAERRTPGAQEVTALLPHPDTACLLAMSYHRELQAEGARERLANQASRRQRPGPVAVAALRHGLGSALVRAGARLQGAPAVVEPSAA